MADKSIIILGSTGMLGSIACKYFNKMSPEGWSVEGLNREHFDAAETWHVRRELCPYIRQGDVVINCVGVLKPDIEHKGRINTININSVFPQIVADLCNECGARFVHICSDCVFTGNAGGYTEADVCDADDLYARTKSLTPDGCSVIRTSFVGPSKQGKGLLEWVKSNNNQSIEGYTNCIWNGMTCVTLCQFIHKCINNNRWWNGVLHAYTHNSVSKFELCKLIARVYDMNVDVKPITATHISGSRVNGVLDRRLASVHSASIGHIQNISIEEQLISQRDFLNHTDGQ
jgi:dTDP-4-dehydrorhamnose reductase